ncbi:low molecular weight phosphotyrosine protein phosphatase [Ectothiorhodospiraceae bacterium BW-2]|nr:low molecular weight phosphotyrosine protein phosphatase [Ectothiorhodospiraceae bacterium BW-2]
MQKIDILFVCMGNICRSPLAHAIFEEEVRQRGWQERVAVDSCGTHAYHIGNRPDPRSCEIAARHGLTLDNQRARQVMLGDFERFDYIVAMDNDNYHHLLQLAPESMRQRVHRLLDFVTDSPIREVPDPYYGGADGFNNVYQLVTAGATALADHLAERFKL